MPEPKQELSAALRDPGPHTAASLAERLPHFSEATIAGALEQLAAAGVLEKETGPDGRPQYRYAAPERYGFANVPEVKLPGPEFGKRE